MELEWGAHRINLIDLERKDFLEYRKWLLDVEKNSARTAGNKLTSTIRSAAQVR
jgi:hypothetical protein